MAKEQEIDDIKLIYKIIKIRLHNLITGINIDEDEKDNTLTKLEIFKNRNN